MKHGDPTWWSRLAGAAAYHAEEARGFTIPDDDPLALARLAACRACPHAGVFADDQTRRVLACKVCRCIVGAQEAGEPFRPAVKALCVRASCPDPTGNRWADLTTNAT